MSRDPLYVDLPPSKPGFIRQVGTSDSVAGAARVMTILFPIAMTALAFLVRDAVTSTGRQMSELSAAVGTINSTLSAGQARGAQRDQRLDKLEVSDGRQLGILNDHEHRLTIVEQVQIAEQSRRLEAIEATMKSRKAPNGRP